MRISYIPAILATIAAVSAQAQEAFQSLEYDPAKITDEMRAQTETIAQALEDLTPEGYVQQSLVERYTPVNMYDKINGRSELFHAYNVTAMTFVTFTKKDDPAAYIDIFLYDMTTPLGAYGVFSVERWPGYDSVDYGDGGYRTETDMLYRKGQYYVTFIGANDSPEVQDAIDVIAEKLTARLKGEAGAIWGLDLLPAENRVEDSVQYLMVDALGLDFLTNTFAATYRDGDDEFQAFVSKQDSPGVASEAMEKLKAYQSDYGAPESGAAVAGHTVALADMGGGFYDAACQLENLVVGVSAVEGKEKALAALTYVVEGLNN